MSGKIPVEQQIDELKREIVMRKDVYPRMVSAGKLRQETADAQMERIKAALATLEWVAKNAEALRSIKNGQHT